MVDIQERKIANVAADRVSVKRSERKAPILFGRAKSGRLCDAQLLCLNGGASEWSHPLKLVSGRKRVYQSPRRTIPGRASTTGGAVFTIYCFAITSILDESRS